MRQLLTESFLLGGTGSALGLVLAPSVARFLVRYLSLSAGAIELPFSLDARILAFNIFVSVAVVLLFGMAPAMATTRIDLTSMLLGSSRTVGGLEPGRRGKWLVAAQVGISCVLLFSALLFGRSFHALSNVDAGFRPQNVLLLRLRTAAEGPTGAERVRLYDRVLQRLAAVPGIRSAALSSESLFSGNTWTEAVSVPGFTPRRGTDRDCILLVVSPGFFHTMGIPMVRGRDVTAGDDEKAPEVAIVNEAMARYYFGEADAVGRTFQVEGGPVPRQLTVVGVVRNSKYKSLKEAAARIVYLPALQTPGPLGEAKIVVRTIGDPAKMADLLWKMARSESPYLQFGGFTTQSQLVDGTIAQDRMLAELSSVFGFSAMVLVCLGLYGLTAYQVSRRTAEIGVRIALGAQRRDVVSMVLKDSLMAVAGGSAIGLCVTLLLGRLVEGLLFGIHAFDIVTLLATPATLAAIGTAAAYWPARTAARLDPAQSLRYE